jgi:hypothetical protein
MYQRTATMITSAGNRNPANAERGADQGHDRAAGIIDQACLRLSDGPTQKTHRPHQGIANARPLAPLPAPITDPHRLAHLNIHRHDRPAAPSTSTSMPPDLPGWHSRQVHGHRWPAPRPRPSGPFARRRDLIAGQQIGCPAAQNADRLRPGHGHQPLEDHTIDRPASGPQLGE